MNIVRAIMQDGTAPTGIMNVPGGNLKALPLLGDFLQGAPYVVKKNPDQTLVIGVGGGIDVLIALYNGSKHVVGVEVNPVTVDAVKNRYADFAGRIFNRPDVELVNAEGRHYLTATDKRFDVIQLSGVDTYSALALGAFNVIGGVYVNNVSKWDRTSWSAFGRGLGGSALGAYTIAPVSSTEFWVGGAFDRAGGKESRYIAHWKAEPTAPVESRRWGTIKEIYRGK